MSSAATSVKPVASGVPFGHPLPPDTPHPLTVSLLTWDDTLGFKNNDQRLIDAMLNVYPRLCDHVSIRKLMSIIQEKYGSKEERCRLFPTRRVAEHCLSFLRRASSVNARVLSIRICSNPDEDSSRLSLVGNEDGQPCNLESPTTTTVHALFHGADGTSLASDFRTYTGTGISSRQAEHYLSMMGEDIPLSFPLTPCACSETLLTDGSLAKRILRQRIASALYREKGRAPGQESSSQNGVHMVSEDDVYLFPTGMAAIWNTHQLALGVRPAAKTACFGFLYVDTYEVLKRWGPGCHFFGSGAAADIDELETLLSSESQRDATKPPIVALITEFPSNPLLQSSDLLRLRHLADKYGFLLIIDDTVGTFANVDVLPYADVLVTSLTKLFSGSANVMGGSLVLNRNGGYYGVLKDHLKSIFEDTYHDGDAIQLEFNSRDFHRRVEVVDRNAEAVCDFFHPQSVAGGASPDAVIKQVFYPKYYARDNYERYRIDDGNDRFGGLFSLTFTSTEASRAFYDALSCWKGPSFGANLTLACAYAILTHYPNETEWAARYGVEKGLVRIGAGLEDTEVLLKMMAVALDAAKAAVSK